MAATNRKTATTDKDKVIIEPSPPASTPLKTPFEITFQPSPQAYVLVGAGGTGARVAALLPKILNAGDSVHVVDHDVVEPRNLIRQHFVHEDVGKTKAAVVAARLKRAVTPVLRDHVEVHAMPEKFKQTTLTEIVPQTRGKRVVVLGCVDNHVARSAIHAARGRLHVWLDSGNLLQHGQIILAAVRASVVVSKGWWYQSGQAYGDPDHPFELVVDNVSQFAPELLQAQKADDGPECAAVVLDSQTAAANQMAAGVMFSLLSAIADGMPICAPFYHFSTVPPMITSEPWKKFTLSDRTFTS